MTRPVLLAVVSDVHAGSTVAVCPPEGVRHDDGGVYHPSKLQLWLWHHWEQFWARAKALRKQHKADLGVLCNGDACDGPGHHGTHQSISPNNAEAQSYVIDRVFSVPKALSPDWWVFVKGTFSHVGQGADSESALAKSLGAEREPETQAWSWYHWSAEVHGVRLDATHHGRSGGRPWTRLSAAGILASEIIQQCAEVGRPLPHVAFRSHKHVPYDTHDEHVVRVVGLPSWQAPTGYSWQVVPEHLVRQQYGGVLVLIRPDGSYHLEKYYFRPDPSPPWRPR